MGEGGGGEVVIARARKGEGKWRSCANGRAGRAGRARGWGFKN